MLNIFQHYSTPQDSHKNNDAFMENARFARIEILKNFVREEAEVAGIHFQPIADLLSLAPELASGKTSSGIELTKNERFRYALLSACNSAAFAFQLLDVPSGDRAAKLSSIESNAKMGLGIEPMKESAEKLKVSHPKIAHMLECAIELVNDLR